MYIIGVIVTIVVLLYAIYEDKDLGKKYSKEVLAGSIVIVSLFSWATILFFMVYLALDKIGWKQNDKA